MGWPLPTNGVANGPIWRRTLQMLHLLPPGGANGVANGPMGWAILQMLHLLSPGGTQWGGHGLLMGWPMVRWVQMVKLPTPGNTQWGGHCLPMGWPMWGGQCPNRVANPPNLHLLSPQGTQWGGQRGLAPGLAYRLSSCWSGRTGAASRHRWVATACQWGRQWSNGVANPPNASHAITWWHSMGWPLPADGVSRGPMGWPILHMLHLPSPGTIQWGGHCLPMGRPMRQWGDTTSK